MAGRNPTVVSSTKSITHTNTVRRTENGLLSSSIVSTGTQAGNNNGTPAVEPGLVVLHQSSLTIDKFVKNGVQKNVHVVVKNQPFLIQLGLAPSVTNALNFHHVTVEASLLYDSLDEKAVDFIRVKPLEYKGQSNEDGTKCTLEMIIKVLSSQHEDMLFKVRLRAIDSKKRTPIAGMLVISDPIQVISKPDVIKPKAEKIAKKRPRNDDILDLLARIESTQREQQQTMNILMERTANLPTVSSTGSPTALNLDPAMLQEILNLASPANTTPMSIDTSNNPPDIEKAFEQFMEAFKALKEEERPRKIRKIAQTSAAVASLPHVVDLFRTEGVTTLPAPSNHLCGTECPHKQELDKLDHFYKEFLMVDSIPMQ